MNYYVLLGVPQDADVDSIRSAFRALARRFHPDVGDGSSADRFREILTAYETLNDPTRRLRYDRTLGDARVSRPQYVEPLRPEIFPEPMLRPTTRGIRAKLAYEQIDPTRFEQLIEELFQSWDEIFCGLPRRRGRG